jgi:hypothetical protein
LDSIKILSDSAYWRNAGEAFKIVKQSALKTKMYKDLKHAEDLFDSMYYNVAFASDLVLIYGTHEAREQVNVFDLSELDRVIMTCYTISSAYEYAVNVKNATMLEMLEEMITNMKNKSHVALNYYCRAYHKLKDLLLNHYASDIGLVTANEIWDDIKKDNLDTLVDYKTWIGRLKGLPADQAIDVAYL